jgi:23S rRNA pseudouridine1911/1915/1917 synthase
VRIIVLYEDDSLIAIDKPAGLVVHPTYKHADGTLLDLLHDREPAAHLSLVGRLDKDTSGIVIAAKNAAAHAALQQIWPGAEKDYLAVVHGRVAEERGEIDLPLGSDPDDRRRRIVTPGGARSLTAFERIASVEVPPDVLSLVRCRLLTGRRHQIRVHLAARGWPVAGDPVYGDPAARHIFPRQALHAWRLVFTHPLSGDRIRIEAPVPLDLREFLAACKLPLI